MKVIFLKEEHVYCISEYLGYLKNDTYEHYYEEFEKSKLENVFLLNYSLLNSENDDSLGLLIDIKLKCKWYVFEYEIQMIKNKKITDIIYKVRNYIRSNK